MGKTFHRKWNEQNFDWYDKKYKFKNRRNKRHQVIHDKQKVIEENSKVELPEFEDTNADI